MEKLFKGKLKFMLPLLMAMIALVFAVTSVFGATGDTTISNTLNGSVGVWTPTTASVSLMWSNTGHSGGFSETNIDLTLQTGKPPTSIWVNSLSNAVDDIDRVLFIATYDPAVVSVVGYEIDQSTGERTGGTWPLAAYGSESNTFYWGPAEGFTMPSGYDVTSEFEVTAVGVGNTAVTIKAVQLPPTS